MRSGDEFIRLFNELSEVLRRKAHGSTQDTFGALVEAAARTDPAVRRHRERLKSIGDLRNAIVHCKGYPVEIIADPRSEIVGELRGLLGALQNPVTVYPRFSREIRVFSDQDPLRIALDHMREGDYSQVVIRVNGEHHVVSSEGIVRWLSGARDIGLADIENTSIGEVRQCEYPGAFRCMRREEPVDAAILAFERALSEGIPRLQAILITQSGRPTEVPLGIITPWDLVNLAGADGLA